MKLAIAELIAAEERLAAGLERARERHSDEHDVHHLSGRLASISRTHVERLAPFAERYGAEGSEPAGRGAEAGSLLGDLVELYLRASHVSIGWTILGQGAQAARDEELLAVVSECHPDSLRQLKWVTTRIKEAAPQLLTG